MNNDERRAALTEALMQALSPIHIQVRDDSGLHAGHAGHGGAGHFAVEVVSAAFVSKNRVMRHQMVYQAAGPLMGQEIHALAIAAKTPEEAGYDQ